MDAMSRREFFRKTGADAALAGLLAASAATLRADPLGLPIGSQTYPHRALVKEGNFAGLAAILAGIGVKTLELCSPLGYSGVHQPLRCQDGQGDPGRPWAHVRERALQHEGAAGEAASSHRLGQRGRHHPDDHGHSCGGGNAPTLDDVKRAADEYNKIAAVAAASGIQQGLHNEGFESSEVDGSGPTTSCSSCSIPRS